MDEPKPRLSDKELIEKQIAELEHLPADKRPAAIESIIADLRDGIADYGQRAERNLGTEAGDAYAAQLAGYRAAMAHLESLIDERTSGQ
jgi:hypothetical protein